MQRLDGFDQAGTPPHASKNQNPCLALWGNGPTGKHCQQCVHLIAIAKSKTYHKCDLRSNTHGSATDHKVRWPACGRFEERVEAIPLYDGRS